MILIEVIRYCDAFTFYLLGFLASVSDRQRPEGQSFSLQQSEGKPAEPGEEERVSKAAAILFFRHCQLWTRDESVLLYLFQVHLEALCVVMMLCVCVCGVTTNRNAHRHPHWASCSPSDDEICVRSDESAPMHEYMHGYDADLLISDCLNWSSFSVLLCVYTAARVFLLGGAC